jgi:YHS domain-containing protein
LVRAVLYLLASIFLITLIRAIMGIILKGFGELFSPKPSSSPARPSVATEGAEPQSLKKDPVCGTFVVSATPHRKTLNGTPYYFCSADCRDKFRG